MSTPSPRPKFPASSSGAHHHPLTRDGSDTHVRTPIKSHQPCYFAHHTAHDHRHLYKTQSPHRHQLSQQEQEQEQQQRQEQHPQQHRYHHRSTRTKMTSSHSSSQAAPAASSSSSSAASSTSGMMQYYYDTGASYGYGYMQQEPAWLMATPIDDDDLTFGGKSLSTWYEEDRRRFSLGDDSSRTMESDEEEESRGRQRVRAHYDAPSTSHRHHKPHGSKSDAVKH